MRDVWPGSRVLAIIVWLIGASFLVLQASIGVSMGVINYSVRHDLVLTGFELSLLSSAAFYIYCLMQAPMGVLLDRVGIKAVLSFGGLFSAFGCYVFSEAQAFIFAFLGRFMYGAGLASSFVALVKLSNHWFPRRYVGLMTGMAETAAMLGAYFGAMLVAIGLPIFGWRGVLQIGSFCIVVVCGMAWLFLSDFPKKVNPKFISQYHSDTAKSWQELWQDCKALLANPYTWLNGCYIGTMYVVVTVFCSMWGVEFIRLRFDVSLPTATSIAGLALAGCGIGSPIIGALFSESKRREFYLLVWNIVLFVIALIVIYVPVPVFMLYFLTFGMGFAASAMILCFSIAIDIAPAGSHGTSMGVANTLAGIPAMIAQPLSGIILNLSSDLVSESGVEIYTAQHYQNALSVLPLMGFLGIIIATRMNKKII